MMDLFMHSINTEKSKFLFNALEVEGRHTRGVGLCVFAYMHAYQANTQIINQDYQFHLKDKEA